MQIDFFFKNSLDSVFSNAEGSFIKENTVSSLLTKLKIGILWPAHLEVNEDYSQLLLFWVERKKERAQWRETYFEILKIFLIVVLSTFIYGEQVEAVQWYLKT